MEPEDKTILQKVDKGLTIAGVVIVVSLVALIGLIFWAKGRQPKLDLEAEETEAQDNVLEDLENDL